MPAPRVRNWDALGLLSTSLASESSAIPGLLGVRSPSSWALAWELSTEPPISVPKTYAQVFLCTIKPSTHQTRAVNRAKCAKKGGPHHGNCKRSSIGDKTCLPHL